MLARPSIRPRPPASPPARLPSLTPVLYLAGCLLLLLGLIPPQQARAQPVAEGWSYAAGHAAPGFFVGQHRKAAGQTVYCTDFERLPPVLGQGYTGGLQGGFTRSDGVALDARENGALSYLLHRWGPAQDNDTAAAVQLAVWAITSPGRGWGTPGMAEILRLASLPEHVAGLGQQLTEQSFAFAGPYTIDIQLDDGAEAGLITAAAVTVRAAAGTAAPGLTVRAMLSGDFQPDDPAALSWTSGGQPHQLPLKRTGLGEGTLRVAVETAPAGAVAWLVPTAPNAQRLLAAPAAFPVEAVSGLASLPAFQPTVSTTTSAPVARAGAEIHDVLTVDVEGRSPSGGTFPWLHDPVSGEPVSVEVESTLWGPLPARPEPSNAVPAGTPRAGTVTTRVKGPGSYKTPPVTLPSPGYYVWTETIDPQTAEPRSAAAHVKPWRSTFGIEAETTIVPWMPQASTRISSPAIGQGGTVTDEVTVAGLPPGREQEVTLTMYGPLPHQPVQADAVPEETPVLAMQKLRTANGTVTSEPFGPLTAAGCYTVVASIAGSTEVKAFRSPFGEPSETVCVSAPAAVPPHGEVPPGDVPPRDVPPADVPPGGVPPGDVPPVAPPAAGPPAETPPAEQAPPAAPAPSVESAPPAAPPAPEAAAPEAAVPEAALAATGTGSGGIAAAGGGLLGLGLLCSALSRRRRGTSRRGTSRPSSARPVMSGPPAGWTPVS